MRVAEPEDADGLEQAQGAKGVGVRGIFGSLEAYPHVALRREIVDFVGCDFLHQADQIGRIGNVAVMEEEADACSCGSR